MNLPFYSYLPVVAGIIGGIIGGVIYKKNRRKKEKQSVRAVRFRM